MRGRTHIARPVSACRIEVARNRRSLPRSSDQAIGNSLGVNNEYARMLYRRGGLRLVPDHYWINGRWGVVSMTDCRAAIRVKKARQEREFRAPVLLIRTEAPKRDAIRMNRHRALGWFKHDLFGKPLRTFPDYAPGPDVSFRAGYTKNAASPRSGEPA